MTFLLHINHFRAMSELFNLLFSLMENRSKTQSLFVLHTFVTLLCLEEKWQIFCYFHCDYTPLSFPCLFFSLGLTFTSPRHLTLNICLHSSLSGRLFSFLSFFFTQCSLPCNLNIPNIEGHLRQQMQITQSDTAHCILHLTDTPGVLSVFGLNRCTSWSVLSSWLRKSVVPGKSCRTFRSVIVKKEKNWGGENSVQKDDVA